MNPPARAPHPAAARTLCLLLLPLLAALANPAAAWSGFGHRLIGLLAEAQLSPEVRAQTDRLLALEPGADLGSIAPWPDEVRREPGYEHTGPLHFVNFLGGSCDYRPARDCANGACVVAGIESAIHRLRDADLPDRERLEALKFLVHFVGDAHQPMHASNRFDRGGNRFQVNVSGEGSNLHAVWDYHLLRSADLSLRQYFARLTPHARTADPGSLDPVDWVLDACRLIDTHKLYPRRPGRLPRTYLEDHRPLAEARVVLAAARLAQVLEAALGDTGGR